MVDEFENANHNPVAAIDGNKENKIKYINSKSGQLLEFDASESSDPDGDKLNFNWWIYEEAGTYPGKIAIMNGSQPKISLQIPGDAAGKEIHLILELLDNNDIAQLYDHRRIVISVE